MKDTCRIDVEIEGGKVKDAWTTGTLFRGFEIILQGRDPRDAWHITQRICGVCPTSHGHASSMSMDDAFKVKPPDNGRIIRNIIEGAQFVHSHILWFYHLNALDYVDVVSALKGAAQRSVAQKRSRPSSSPLSNPASSAPSRMPTGDIRHTSCRPT